MCWALGRDKATKPKRKVLRSSVWQRAHGRRSKDEKAQGQQQLNPSEEEAIVKYLLRMSNNGYPVPVTVLCKIRVPVLVCARSFHTLV